MTAPVGGVVVMRMATRGDYVKTGSVLYEIADPNAECNAKLGSALVSDGTPHGLDCEQGSGGLYEVIARAEKWLASHSYRNPLLKWDTENWGEIPADFGRK